jgi:tetratricopeptide (TPR) repeat protein
MSTRGKTRRPWAWIGLAILIVLPGLGFLLAPAIRRSTGQIGHLASAKAAYAEHEWTKAAELARTRLKAQGNDSEALRILARASIRLGRDGLATDIYQHRLGAADIEAEDLFLMGVAMSRQGQDDVALDLWSKAEKKSPQEPEYLLPLANLLARKQHLDEAVELAHRLSRIPGWEAVGLLFLGTTQTSLENAAASVAALQRGLELDPEARGAPLDAAFYRKLLARGLLMLGKAEDADRWLKPLVEASTQSSPDPEAFWLASRAALQRGQIERARTELTRSANYRADHPHALEPSPYAGSEKCSKCHAEISRDHAQTRHARTFHHGAKLLDLPRPQGPLTDPDHPDVSHTFVQEGKKLHLQTKVDDHVYETLIDYAFGTRDRYVTMIGRDGDGGFRALRRSYFHEGKESGWGRSAGDAGNTNKVEEVRGQPIHVRDGIVRCLHCHVTNPREFRDPDNDGPGPETADHGIGCERCHGPSANHILASEADFPDRALVNVGPVSAEAVTIQCRECHIVGDATEIQNRREDPIWVRSPGVTLTFSRCYTESNGALSCLSCHDPHRDSERSPSFYEKKCLACHSAQASQVSNPTICKVNPRSDCLSCHMPKVRQPVLHTFLTDHYIRVHRDGPAKKTGLGAQN